MADLKDLLYLGFGSALMAKEKIEAEARELVEKGKLTKEQQKEFVEKAKAKAKEEEEALNAKVKTMIKDALKEMGIATKEDLEELKKLIQEK